MKKIMLVLGLMFTALTLTNCSQEIDEAINSNTMGEKFAITANILETRTTIDGFETSWSAGDSLTLFHYDGSAYTYDGTFKNSADELTVFEGTEPTLDDATAYTWYAIYPGNAYNDDKTPAYTAYDNVGYAAVTQDGYNSTAHICGENAPLWSKIAKEAGDYAVQFTMHHLCSLLEFQVKNETAEPFVIESVTFTSDTNHFVGTYHLNLTGESVEYTASGETFVYKSATVTVENGAELAANEVAKIYLPIRPYTTSATEQLTIAVKTNKGTQEITRNVSGAKFAAGVVKKFAVGVDAVVSNAIALPWTESFDSDDLTKYTLANGGGTTKYYSDNTAGGAAAGEILIAKGNGSMTALIASDGTAKTLHFWFTSNYPSYIAVSSTTEGVTIDKMADTYYTVALAEGVEEFALILTNTAGSNARVDDIVLTADAPEVESISVSGATVSFTTEDEFVFDGTVTATYENGWSETIESGYTVNSDAVNMNNPDTYTVTVTYQGLEASYEITVTEAGVVLTYDDVLNRAFTGVSNGAGYSAWTGKTGASPAVYAGQSAGGNSSIQLRSSNSNSGIVTTTSGGYATKVVVTWNSNTASGRTLDIYGKNSAYSAATDLYSSSTQGTKLGSIVCGTSTELVIEGAYEYIGLRSKSSAMYLTDITISWSSEPGSGSGEGGETPEPEVTLTTGSGEGTEASPYDVTRALEAIEKSHPSISSAYVKGIISQIDQISTQYGNATYYISVNGSTTNQLQVYRGLYLNGEDFTSADALHVGDVVVIKGELKDYNGTKEFNAGSVIVSLECGHATPDPEPDPTPGTGETQTVTMNIYGSTGTLSNNNKTITWTSGDVTVTNNQASSSTAIRTSDTSYYRSYKNSQLVFSVASGTISTIVVTCNSSTYATTMVTSFTNAGYTASASGSTVTVTGSAQTFTITNSAATWFSKVVVTYAN